MSGKRKHEHITSIIFRKKLYISTPSIYLSIPQHSVLFLEWFADVEVINISIRCNQAGFQKKALKNSESQWQGHLNRVRLARREQDLVKVIGLGLEIGSLSKIRLKRFKSLCPM